MKSVTPEKRIYAILWAGVVFFSCYYIITNCLRYFVFEPKNYHFDFFWNRKYWLFVHVVSGMIATIASPFQFISYLRSHYLKLHKVIGYTYVSGIVISSVTSFYLCATTPENIWYSLGLTGFTVAWLVTAAIGMIYAIKGKLIQHKEWMVRSFVVTVGFSISRLLEDMVVHSDADVARIERLTILAWVSWILPLLITELIIIRKRNIQKPQTLSIKVASNNLSKSKHLV